MECRRRLLISAHVDQEFKYFYFHVPISAKFVKLRLFLIAVKRALIDARAPVCRCFRDDFCLLNISGTDEVPRDVRVWI